MKKMGFLFFSMLLFCLITGCATKSYYYPSNKNSEYIAMLLDPAIRKEFRELKKVAAEAQLYTVDGRTHMAHHDIKRLNEITKSLIYQLSKHYHIDPIRSEVHTYIGKNEYDSCYQYYNSLGKYFIGRTCKEFPQGFSSCELCNIFIKKLRTPRSLGIMHLQWINNQKATALVDSILLKNGERAYVGLQLS